MRKKISGAQRVSRIYQKSLGRSLVWFDRKYLTITSVLREGEMEEKRERDKKKGKKGNRNGK